MFDRIKNPTFLTKFKKRPSYFYIHNRHFFHSPFWHSILCHIHLMSFDLLCNIPTYRTCLSYGIFPKTALKLESLCQDDVHLVFFIFFLLKNAFNYHNYGIKLMKSILLKYIFHLQCYHFVI
uniref:(northern house mosquito) hypothetical protein n=1 Tax=Culex pipiens TaxID=7175 RepID=A0A8D8FTF8_CULPI